MDGKVIIRDEFPSKVRNEKEAPAPSKLVTRESLQKMIDTASRRKREQIVGRALVALLKRQTSAEQNCQQTLDANGIGFSGCDGRTGTVSAKVFRNTGTMKGWVLDKWLKPQKNGYARITKYHKQLNEIAVEREQEFTRRIKGNG